MSASQPVIAPRRAPRAPGWVAIALLLCLCALTACGGGAGSDTAAAPTQGGGDGGGGSGGGTPGSGGGSGGGSAPPTTGSATLQWSASADSRVVGYRVYWGTASGSYQARGDGQDTSGSSHVVSGLPSGQTYYFAVTAVDAAGIESAFSAEATKTIP